MSSQVKPIRPVRKVEVDVTPGVYRGPSIYGCVGELTICASKGSCDLQAIHSKADSGSNESCAQRSGNDRSSKRFATLGRGEIYMYMELKSQSYGHCHPEKSVEEQHL